LRRKTAEKTRDRTLHRVIETCSGDFNIFRAALREQGLLKREPVRVLIELGVHISVAMLALFLILTNEHILLRLFSMLTFSTALMGISTNTHTSSHFATSKHTWRNEALTYLGYSLINGLSSNFWWEKHGIHHKHPNVIGVDDDIDLMPFFALCEDHARHSSLWVRMYYSLQWLAFPFALGLNGVNMQLNSIRYIAKKITEGKGHRYRYSLDAFFLILHFVLWFVLPATIFPWTHVVGFYVVNRVLMGYLMFTIFGPSHLPPEAVFVGSEARESDHVFRQTATTLNYRTGPLGGLVCSGLQLQIEHHLFPWISHTCYPRIRPYLKSFCERYGYPYREFGWAESVWKSLRILYRPKPVHDQWIVFDSQEHQPDA